MEIPKTEAHIRKVGEAYAELTFGLSDMWFQLDGVIYRLMFWDVVRVACGIASFPDIIVWDQEGQPHSLTKEQGKDWLAFAYERMTTRMPNYARLRTEIVNATEEELKDIDTTEGWPSRHSFFELKEKNEEEVSLP